MKKITAKGSRINFTFLAPPPPLTRPLDSLLSKFLLSLQANFNLFCRQFFERIILCNSLVWTCSITGRPGLTYQEALDSEERAKKRLADFPNTLQKPILYLSLLTHRSRLNDLNDDVFVFARDRYFIGETVEVHMGSEKYVYAGLSHLQCSRAFGYLK